MIPGTEGIVPGEGEIAAALFHRSRRFRSKLKDTYLDWIFTQLQRYREFRKAINCRFSLSVKFIWNR
jgi:hypothetical protein